MGDGRGMGCVYKSSGNVSEQALQIVMRTSKAINGAGEDDTPSCPVERRTTSRMLLGAAASLQSHGNAGGTDTLTARQDLTGGRGANRKSVTSPACGSMVAARLRWSRDPAAHLLGRIDIQA